MAIQYLPVSWSQYHLTAQKLAATILSHNLHLDEIVAISRGGLTLGHLLSDFLILPVSTFTIQSYSDYQTRGEAKIISGISKPLTGKQVLLVDDVADSGTTIKRALEYLHTFNPAGITTVTMFYKPTSSYRPDFFARQTRKWILFPYESTEMINILTRKMESEGKNKAQIQEFIEKNGYNINQIAFVRKYHLQNPITK